MNEKAYPWIGLAGRVLVAAVFLHSGVGKVLGFEGISAFIASKGIPISFAVAGGAALLEIACGLALLFGFKVRLAGFLLAAFTVAATVLFHNFWSEPPGMMRMMQTIMFSKNLAILGGLLFIIGFGPGAFALSGRRGPA
ncbi:DoxX family protein [Noviherbaspirillum sp. Root189]|uniref:DoxX family protein n=1 Tax=Noviherbaspirillum sp. Root189 TaxID=1736487 RepID=UPI00070DF0F1|nr:DoxX family protein [Noviherbaspirillum sp. Root189]KRB93565.1 hypothetical protein ASE07_12790 [Noviherbaspirillum sp. Root189]